MKTYLCTYYFHGDKYEFEIQADSITEACDRMLAIKCSALVEGELMATIPVPTFWGKLVAWWYEAKR